MVNTFGRHISPAVKARGRRDDFEITLINKENYFVFQPMPAEVVSGAIGLTDAVSCIRRLQTWALKRALILYLRRTCRSVKSSKCRTSCLNSRRDCSSA